MNIDKQFQFLFGKRGLWTPASLFAQGEEGVWYEPKPEYLFQDEAGTTPVTGDGQLVGLMIDRSGNGNHVTQKNSASRKPLYRTENGLHWLEFDGVDDGLSSIQNISFTNSDDAKVTYGVAYQAINTNTGYILHSSGDENRRRSTPFGILSSFEGEDELLFANSSANNVPSNLNKRSIATSYDRGTQEGEYKSDNTNYLISHGTGVTVPNLLTIGFRTPSSPSVHWNGKLFSLFISNQFDINHIDKIDKYNRKLIRI